MKILSTITAVFALALTAQAQLLVDFNGGSELANDFAGLDGTTPFTQSATDGLSNSGSVVTNSTSQIAVYQTSFDATALSSDTFSVYFQYNGSSNSGRGVSLGFTTGATDTYSSSATTDGTDLRVTLNGAGSGDNYGIQILNNGTAVDTSSSDVTLVDNNWYFLQLTIGGLSGNDFTGVEAELFDSNSAGVVGSSLKLLDNGGGGGYTITSATLAADTDAYAFFGGQNASTRAASNFDNFEVSAIPEPSSALLLGLACLGLWAMRRRTAV